jgi:hypothetical protein
MSVEHQRRDSFGPPRGRAEGRVGLVSWEISANLGRRPRPGVDAGGWLWEITRGDQVEHVLIEISGTAWARARFMRPPRS